MPESCLYQSVLIITSQSCYKNTNILYCHFHEPESQKQKSPMNVKPGNIQISASRVKYSQNLRTLNKSLSNIQWQHGLKYFFSFNSCFISNSCGLVKRPTPIKVIPVIEATPQHLALCSDVKNVFPISHGICLASPSSHQIVLCLLD